MSEIKCPNCGKTFKIDEQDYLNIVSQVRNETFQKELSEAIEKQKLDSKKDNELELIKKESSHQQEIESYKQKINSLENEISNFSNQIEITKLQVQKDSEEKINALNEELLEKERQIKSKDDEIAYVKDMKARLSNKLVGESLEQFCKNEFEKIRSLFPVENIYFEKDNDARTGSKGDFILREQTGNGAELYSIMFEMKNESSQSATKHKNEDFFKELDKDRNEKKCEYAVLVSTLESDSDFYNGGIVNVSHRYNKMYVIRPQCFIPFITIIRSASLTAAEYKDNLEIYKNQNYDIRKFEDKFNDFRDKFNKNVQRGKSNFEDAIKRIDAIIDNLNKTKTSLISSMEQFAHADKKISDISIKKLARGNPTVSALLNESNEEIEEEN